MLTVVESRGIALARGIIVFLIAPIHCVMVYSTPEVKHGFLGKFMAFFAENPGAHLFMFLMGAFIVFSREKPYSVIIKRFAVLLVAGWLLNVFKFVIPNLFNLLPDNFFKANYIIQDHLLNYRLLFINDILQFAAFAYLICSLLRKIKWPLIIAYITGGAVLFYSPIFWDKGNTGSFILNVFIDLAGGFPPKTYFPLFPWLFHCLSGMVFALLFQKKLLSPKAFVAIGIIFVLLGEFITAYEPSAWNATFFRAGPGGTLFHNGVTILWVSAFVYIRRNIPYNKVFYFFEWCSDHITSIYLIQWCIIMWLLLWVGYEKSGLLQSLLLIAATSLISLYIANTITKNGNK